MTRTALSLIAFACLSIGALASNKEKKTVRKVEIDVYDRMVVEHSPSDPNLDFECKRQAKPMVDGFRR
jgi:hypothetical protein